MKRWEFYAIMLFDSVILLYVVESPFAQWFSIGLALFWFALMLYTKDEDEATKP